LSPEGNRPKQQTRIFGADVGRQLCIGVFARYGAGDAGEPAIVHTRKVIGTASEKIQQLHAISPKDSGWAKCASGWQEAFRPKARDEWLTFVPLTDLLPWTSRGVTAGRTWVYAPEAQTLRERWAHLVTANPRERPRLFKESRDRSVNRTVAPLPGFEKASAALNAEPLESAPPLVAVGYRSFDRQWLIADSRALEMPRPPLWSVRSERQIYVTEQSNHPITSGPALTFTELIPDLDHYNARSGRVLPLYRDALGGAANLPPSLLAALEQRLGTSVAPEHVLAYVAGVTAHPAYTQPFRPDLEQPGVRIPITNDPGLWKEAVKVGRHVIWLHTFGNRCIDPSVGRPHGLAHLVEAFGPRVVREIPDTPDNMPDTIHHDPPTETLRIGRGAVARVSERVYAYDVAGMQVVRHWFGYRSKSSPHRRRSTPLDDINQETWTPARTAQLLELLTILDRCVALEPEQQRILDEICEGALITPSDLAEIGVLPVPVTLTRPPSAQPDGDVLF
jgi:hypothetical protein